MSAGNGHVNGPSAGDLRAEVRAVLADLLGDGTSSGLRADLRGSLDRSVELRTDADLDAFVRDIAARCEDPVERAALREGRRRFRLALGSAAGSADRPQQAAGGVVRVERGAVTERTVGRAAADRARLVLGPRAVLTPLARDKARTLGVEIERER